MISTAEPLHDAHFLTAHAPEGVAPRFSVAVPLNQPRENVARASLTSTAHGVYEASIDGLNVTGSVLNPGWTSYEWRLAYQTYEVAGLIRRGKGELRVELLLGNGWYRGRLGFAGADANYGDEIAAAAAVDIEFMDGSRQRIVTSTAWTATESDITRNSLYNGQTIDARLRDAPATPRGAHAPISTAPRWSRRALPRSFETKYWPRYRSGHRRRVARWWTSGRIWSAGCGSP